MRVTVEGDIAHRLMPVDWVFPRRRFICVPSFMHLLERHFIGQRRVGLFEAQDKLADLCGRLGLL